MDFRALQQFLTLSETLHFGQASGACHISPSALSRSIKQLEEDLGVTLFLRDNRSVELTSEGRMLQDYARSTLQNWETFQESLSLTSGQLRGEISIYCSVTASYSFLYDILSRFRACQPQISIILHTGDPAEAIDRVMSRQEDIAIAARPEKLSPELSFQSFAQSPLVFICAENQTDQYRLGKTFEQNTWQRWPMIISESGIGREKFDQWMRHHNIKPNIYAQVGGNEAIVSMVSLGFGVGLVPKIVVDNSPLASRIAIIENQPCLASYDVGVCVLKKRLKSPLINALWEQLQPQQPEF